MAAQTITRPGKHHTPTVVVASLSYFVQRVVNTQQPASAKKREVSKHHDAKKQESWESKIRCKGVPGRQLPSLDDGRCLRCFLSDSEFVSLRSRTQARGLRASDQPTMSPYHHITTVAVKASIINISIDYED